MITNYFKLAIRNLVKRKGYSLLNILLVGISFLIAVPITWWIMHNWLQDFAYRINMPWWVFAIAGIVAGLIAFVKISFQAIKAAIATPVKSLRTE
jgi:putative ABC transport system permease protein